MHHPLEINTEGWSDFRASLLRYAELPRDRRNELWFRGQGDSSWPLSATLDRIQAFQSASERDRTNSKLLKLFKTEATHVGMSETILMEWERLELLARHHGLPSPLMDWTLSPYVATYFAYANASEKSDCVSVWCLDLEKVDWSHTDDLTLMRDDLPFFENRRALQQRSVFLRLSVPDTVESLVPHALTRFDLPFSDRTVALQDLDEMLVNATTMFYDLEGAAKTSLLRFLGS